ncbi:MAG: lysylphosphatidylglycerol synthase transmembrane domain-containing protein [Candidatus Heimdallarchaeota archaeon]
MSNPEANVDWQLTLDTRRILLTLLFLIPLVIYMMIVGPSQIWEALISLNLQLALIAFLLFYLSAFIRAFRWQIFLESLDKNKAPPSLIDLFIILIFSASINNAFPIRMGDLYRPYELNNSYNYSFLSAASTIIFEKALDIFAMLGLIIGVVVLQGTSELVGLNELVQTLLFLIAVLIAFMIFLLLLQNARTAQIFVSLVNSLATRTSKRIISDEKLKTREIAHQVRLLIGDKRNFIVGLFSSILIWINAGVIFWIVLVSAGLDVPILPAILVMLLAALIGNSIFGVAGLGQLPFMIGFLVILGVTNHAATSACLAYLIITLWLVIPIGILAHYCKTQASEPEGVKNLNDPLTKNHADS